MIWAILRAFSGRAPRILREKSTLPETSTPGSENSRANLLSPATRSCCFRAPVESLNVNLSLKESRLEIANFELRRKSDSFRRPGEHGFGRRSRLLGHLHQFDRRGGGLHRFAPGGAAGLSIRRKSRPGLDGKRSRRRPFRHLPRRADTGSVHSDRPPFPSMRNSKAIIRRTIFSSGNSISQISTPPSAPSSR